jgi:hypothetical protein
VRHALTLLLLALLAAPALAEDGDAQKEKKDSDAARSISFSNRLGLTGFQDLIDARTPRLVSVRGGVRYDLSVLDQDFDGALKASRKKEEHQVGLWAAASVFGLVDVSGRVPYVYRRSENNLKGLAEKVDRDRGWGDFDLAAKVTLNLGGFAAIAPYVHGRFPTGEPEVEELMTFEWGVAGTLSLFNDYLAVHGNIAGLNQEEGLAAMRFRVGASFVVWSDELALVRIYGYGDGIEYEGHARTDLDLEFGAQALLFGFLSIEAGFSTRLLDSGFLDDSTKKVLREQQGVFDRHFDDDGTWGLYLSAGVNFTF